MRYALYMALAVATVAPVAPIAQGSLEEGRCIQQAINHALSGDAASHCPDCQQAPTGDVG